MASTTSRVYNSSASSAQQILELLRAKGNFPRLKESDQENIKKELQNSNSSTVARMIKNQLLKAYLNHVHWVALFQGEQPLWIKACLREIKHDSEKLNFGFEPLDSQFVPNVMGVKKLSRYNVPWSALSNMHRDYSVWLNTAIHPVIASILGLRMDYVARLCDSLRTKLGPEYSDWHDHNVQGENMGSAIPSASTESQPRDVESYEISLPGCSIRLYHPKDRTPGIWKLWPVAILLPGGM